MKRILQVVIATAVVTSFLWVPAVAVDTLQYKQGISLVKDGASASAQGNYGRIIMGWDGSAFQFVSVNSSGEIATTGGGGATGTPADGASNPSAIQQTEAFNMLWDSSASDWNRATGDGDGQTYATAEDGGILTGHYTPKANSPVVLSATGVSGCTADLTNNAHFKVRVLTDTADTVHCCWGASGDCTADTSDQIFSSGNDYSVYVAAQDRPCCLAVNSGAAKVMFEEITYQ